MGIWDWALEIYSLPGAPQACLSLQDDHGQNTSLLLWAVYAETADSELLAKAAAATRTFDQTMLTPLRTVRRALKAPMPPVADAGREALREQVKGLELAAERLLMETLEGLSAHRGGANALAALTAASAAWGPPAPPGALVALAATLAQG